MSSRIQMCSGPANVELGRSRATSSELGGLTYVLVPRVQQLYLEQPEPMGATRLYGTARGGDGGADGDEDRLGAAVAGVAQAAKVAELQRWVRSHRESLGRTAARSTPVA